MSRKHNRPQIKAYDQTKEVNRNLNKHGELKLKHKNKAQKKKLISGCMHHALKKNGTPKSRVFINSDGTATCRICGRTFRYTSKTKKEMKQLIKPVSDVVDLAKWTLQASCVGDQKTADFLQQTTLTLDRIPTIVARENKMYSKSKQAQKKRRRNGYDSKSGSDYGQWETTK